MRFAATVTAVIISLMASGPASAADNCADHGIADCGAFIFTKNTCKTFDAKGRPTGVQESMWIVYNDASLGRLATTLDVTSDLASYSAALTPESAVFVNHQSRILADIKNKSAYTYFYLDNGLKSTEQSCQLLDPKER